MTMPPQMANWLRRIDLDLEEPTPAADRLHLIQRAEAQLSRNMRLLDEWLNDPAADRPNPLGEGVTAYDLTEIAHELHARRVRVEAEMNERIDG